MIAPSRLPLLCAGLVAAASLGHADTIYKTDGTKVEDATVSVETLTDVAFSKGRSEQTIPSDQVLRVEYSSYPDEVDEALAFLNEDDFLNAMQSLDNYVDGQIAKPSARRKWAPAFAAWRVAQLRDQVADYPGVIAAAKRLVEHFPQSRYVPEAYLLEARVEHFMGKGADAQATLDQLAALVSEKPLSKRWQLACDLAKVQIDASKTGAVQRAAIAAIEKEADGAYPTVRNNAQLAEGESYLSEAERKPAADAKNLRDEAQKIFQALIDDPTSDGTVLAGAYTGMGDCLFFEGAAKDDKEVLEEAAKRYLRVVLNHPAASQYVPKALYYASRCFEIMGDGAKRNDMRNELKKLYPDSPWTSK